MFKKITVIGLGYVGLAQALLFNERTDVIAYDIDDLKVSAISKGINPVGDPEISAALARKPLRITTNFQEAIKASELIIICTPTNFDETMRTFDLSSVEKTLAKLEASKVVAPILIKSTLAVGTTARFMLAFPTLSLIVSPEFLREGKSLHDNYYPSRIVLGFAQDNLKTQDYARKIALIYTECAKKKPFIQIVFTGPSEAEAIKLFSNTYLAMRVAFFNELDTYSLEKNLATKDIINGVSLDPRIGDFYHNPSFGYGGYCLPKDTKGLKESFGGVPENLVSATIIANETRKAYISNHIIKTLGRDFKNKIVGVYRLVMKKDAANMRESSVISVLNALKEAGLNLLIYEPLLLEPTFAGSTVTTDLAHFKKVSDLIIANRLDEPLNDVLNKVFTRDLYFTD